MNLAAKIFKKSFLKVAEMLASISPLLIMTLLEKIELQAWFFQLVSKSLISYVIRLLKEKVFYYLAFFVFLYNDLVMGPTNYGVSNLVTLLTLPLV